MYLMDDPDDILRGLSHFTPQGQVLDSLSDSLNFNGYEDSMGAESLYMTDNDYYEEGGF